MKKPQGEDHPSEKTTKTKPVRAPQCSVSKNTGIQEENIMKSVVLSKG